MRCPKCGVDLSSNNKFCPDCGEKIEVELSSDFEQVVENNEPKVKNKVIAIWNKLSMYEKVSVVAIIVFVLMALIAIVAGKTAATILSIISILLVVISYLLEKGVIKAPRSWLNIVALILAFSLIIPYIGNFKANYSRAEAFEWSDVVLNDIIPEPDSIFGELHSNSSEYFSVDIYKIDKNDFKSYVEDCKEKGFTVDVEQLSDSFCAFNEDGYKLSVSFSEYRGYIRITLEAPEKYDTFEWPTNGLAVVLPTPESNVGKIEKNDGYRFSVYVSQMTIDDYKAYVSNCSNNGFNIESLNNQKSYSAKNIDGYKLVVEYKGNNVICISVDVPEYDVSVEIECVENLVFSTYNIDVYIDGALEGTVVHGGTKTFNLTLKKGFYILRFVSDDDKLENEVILNIYQNEKLRYKLSCYSTEIDIETLVGTLPPKNEEGTIDGYKIDYIDAKSFETALNEGKKVNGKIVQFVVNDYKPDSALGINCWAGEHLNFISQKELTVTKGDSVVAYVTSEPCVVFGSWEIKCEILTINSGEIDTTLSTKEEKTTEPATDKTAKIKVTMSEDEFKKLKTKEAEKKLKGMGFTVFKYETLDAGNEKNLDGKIGAVDIKSWELGKGDFSKGDVYDSDAIVVLWTYKYTKPESVSYSTNDKITVKNGNSGVYAYKNVSGSYDVYWIIDFDEGYVYWFTDGNGDECADRLKIESGNLNSVAIITYHDGNAVWSNGLHFKYKNQPDHLIVEDHNGFENDFYPTDLNNALNIRNTKTILNY